MAFPTETVYGLGADAFDARAIGNIFEAKQRPADNPLIAHVSTEGQIREITARIPERATRLMEAFFPGPLTLVLPKAPAVPMIATAGLETIGVRMPGHPVAREFLQHCGRAVVAPSANLSGRPSPTTWQAVSEDLDGRIDCVLQSDPTMYGLESTVVDCTPDVPVLLRKGALTLEDLRRVIPEIRDVQETADETPRSPGLKHRHYSPRATVILVESGVRVEPQDSDAFIGLNPPAEPIEQTRIPADIDAYAREIFEFFRECDRKGISRIFCEAVPEEGIGAALMDRIRRAAAG